MSSKVIEAGAGIHSLGISVAVSAALLPLVPAASRISSSPSQAGYCTVRSDSSDAGPTTRL